MSLLLHERGIHTNGLAVDTSTSHLGFRCVIRPAETAQQ